MRWWVRTLAILLISASGYLFYRYRLHETKKVHGLELTASNLEKDKTEIQYQNLMNQFNPHFLFNSLTSLNSLIYDNQELASEFLEHLSKVYRYLLTNKENKLVSIDSEIDFVESYISLLKIRFEKGIEVDININPVHRFKKIVPVTFQILIENAIKHNIIDAGSPLKISFTSANNYITVSNNIQRKAFVDTSNKKGLMSLRTMYKFLSPNPLIIEEEDDTFFIRIPVI
jgi:LytS/YehU family sensor histidine kinase